MTATDIAQKYVALCKEGKNEECLNTLYAKDAVSVEAVSPPSGEDRVASGLDAIRAKGKSWGESNTVHKAEVGIDPRVTHRESAAPASRRSVGPRSMYVSRPVEN